MSTQQILARERRWAPLVAILAITALALYIGSVVIEQRAELPEGGSDSDAEQLRAFDESSGTLLAAVVVRGFGFLCLIAPLGFLFLAAQARSERVRMPLIGFAILAPVLLATQGIVAWAASTSIASDFVAVATSSGPILLAVGELAGGAASMSIDAGSLAELSIPPPGEPLADTLIEDSSGRDAATGLLFSGGLALLVAMVYMALQAMRAGLLTRFWGSLGMALGVSVILILPVALLGILLWLVYVGLLGTGWVVRGRPPAWDAGRAVPWPKPGEQPSEGDGEEAGLPEGFGEESGEVEPEPSPASPDSSPRAARRKRKRRR